ncbi:hypothetical protein Ahia01_000844800, partial [Argonauta hians]
MDGYSPQSPVDGPPGSERLSQHRNYDNRVPTHVLQGPYVDKKGPSTPPAMSVNSKSFASRKLTGQNLRLVCRPANCPDMRQQQYRNASMSGGGGGNGGGGPPPPHGHAPPPPSHQHHQQQQHHHQQQQHQQHQHSQRQNAMSPPSCGGSPYGTGAMGPSSAPVSWTSGSSYYHRSNSSSSSSSNRPSGHHHHHQHYTSVPPTIYR